MDPYREEILEHWRNPQNWGQMPKADLVIDQINPLCGDRVTFYFKFSKSKDMDPAMLHPALASSLRSNRDIKYTNSSDAAGTSNIPDAFGVAGSREGNPRLSPTSNVVSIRSNLRIRDVKFTGNGCAISIASASILSENIKNKSISEVSRITGKDVLKLIGGSVAPARLKCAFLGLEAIRKICQI